MYCYFRTLRNTCLSKAQVRCGSAEETGKLKGRRGKAFKEKKGQGHIYLLYLTARELLLVLQNVVSKKWQRQKARLCGGLKGVWWRRERYSEVGLKELSFRVVHQVNKEIFECVVLL